MTFRTPQTLRAAPPIGVSIGSAYQNYFAGLDSQTQQAEIARMRAAGITWVRMDVDWNDTVQPSASSPISWSSTNPQLLTAQAFLTGRMNVAVILLWSPTDWALAAGNNPAVPNCPYPTIAPTAYAAFCGAAAATFGPLGVSVFELWNEPNLDDGQADHALGLGHLSPIGYAALAAAARAAIHDQYVPAPGASPIPTVLGGTLSAEARLDVADAPRPAGWPAVLAGSNTTSVAVSCAAATAQDLYKLVAGPSVSVSADGSAADGLWPGGTYVSQVTPGVGYRLSPPPWMTQFPAINASTAASTIGVRTGYPPDVFLTQMYAAAAGQQMFDALSMHPYVFPSLSGFPWLDSGSWAMVPALRQIMVAHGDAAKPIWFTELGCPTGQNLGTWQSAVNAGAQKLTVTSGTARGGDVGFLVGSPGLPLGTYVGAATDQHSWTLFPPTGLTVAQPLTSGSSITQLSVTLSANLFVAGSAAGAEPTPVATPAVTITPGTELTVWLGNGNGYYAGDPNTPAPPATISTIQPPFVVTVTAVNGSSAPTGVTPGTTVTLTVQAPGGSGGPVTVPGLPKGYAFPAGGAVQAMDAPLPGQSWPIAIPAQPQPTVLEVLAPGLPAPAAITAPGAMPSALMSEDQQALIITHSFQTVQSTPWPYVGPMFVYCWSDVTSFYSAGAFGLTRVDGSAKPALAALTAIAQPSRGQQLQGLPGYTS